VRIEKLESWVMELPAPAAHRDYVDATMELIGVELTTASGLVGLGLTYTAYYGGGTGVKAVIDAFADRVVGAEPSAYKAIWQDLEWRTRRLGRGPAMMAMSAIDIALWDLLAKAQDVPLAVALGQVTDRVPLYGSGKGSPMLTDEELVAGCVEYVESGYVGVKLRVGYGTDVDLRKVGKVRQAVGDAALVMCDANERMDLPTALRLAQRLDEYDVYWLEEPTRSNHIGSFAHLAASSPVPIAVGEHLQTRWDFAPFAEQRAAAIFQPNATTVGGITEIMRIAALASAYEIPVAPHFLTELHVHVAAAIDNPGYLEYFPFLDEVIADPLRVEDGHGLVPDRPGHGISIRPDALENYRIA
jgi:L-alanine-DL-glutamate epimerase-like enolase superfamily enzyme